MPIQQTGRFYIEGGVRQARRPRQSAGAPSLRGGVGVREIPGTPGHADGPVGLGYSGRSTPSRLGLVSGAHSAHNLRRLLRRPCSPLSGVPLSCMANLESNQSMEPTSLNVSAPSSRELLRTSRAAGRKASPTSSFSRSAAHLQR